MNTKNKQKGFTLVELVIVIAVIAILAGVLIPTFSGVVENAKKSSALQNCKNTYQEAAMASANVGIDFEGKVFECDDFYFEIKDGALKETEKPNDGYKSSDLTNGVKLWDKDSSANKINKGFNNISWTGDHNCALITFTAENSFSLTIYDEEGNVYYSESNKAKKTDPSSSNENSNLVDNGCYFCMYNPNGAIPNGEGKYVGYYDGTPSSNLLANTTEAAAEGWYSYKLVIDEKTISYGVFYYSAK